MTQVTSCLGKQQMEYLVTCFATGPRCAAIAALPTATVLARVLAQLDSVFASTRKAGDPTPSQAFLSGTMHVWNARNEPWVRGAYCPPVASEPPWARKALLEPHAGCVYFAGKSDSAPPLPQRNPQPLPLIPLAVFIHPQEKPPRAHARFGIAPSPCMVRALHSVLLLSHSCMTWAMSVCTCVCVYFVNQVP